MPSQSYRITEPHPSVPASHYLYSGRGGMGNFNHLDPKSITAGSTASGPASRANLASNSSSSSGNSTRRSGSSASNQAGGSYYPAGRGGAGNMHSAYASERPIFSFDEELERQQRMMQHMAPVYHIGRGGAGNFAATSGSRGADGSDTSSLSRRSSSGSESSGGVNMVNGGVRNSLEGTWHRLRDSFAK